MVITILYKAILAWVLVFVVWNMLTTKNLNTQLGGAMLVVPFLLKLLDIR
jgi:hypothetical protein